MGKTKMLKELISTRIVPVITFQSMSEVEPVASALKEAGMNILEITLRTPVGMEAAKLLAQDKNLIVGVGSVVKEIELEVAKGHGIQFAVSPGTHPKLMKKSLSINLQYFPGIASASEIMECIDNGFSTLKFFPAEVLGGVNALKAISSPFPSLKFIPTGGLVASNFKSYLDCENVLAVGGSWMVTRELIEQQSFAAIKVLAKSAICEVAV